MAYIYAQSNNFVMTVKEIKDLITSEEERIVSGEERRRLKRISDGRELDEMDLLDRVWALKYTSLRKRISDVNTREGIQQFLIDEIERDVKSISNLVYQPMTPHLDAHIRGSFGFIGVLTGLLKKII